MRNRTNTQFLTRTIAGLGIFGWAVLAANASGCGQAAITPQLVQCKLDALRVLPEDPKQATVADAIDLIGRIKACHETPDGGSP